MTVRLMSPGSMTTISVERDAMREHWAARLRRLIPNPSQDSLEVFLLDTEIIATEYGKTLAEALVKVLMKHGEQFNILTDFGPVQMPPHTEKISVRQI